jgi:hypothetical protein
MCRQTHPARRIEGGDVAGGIPVPDRVSVLVQLVLGEEHGHLDLAGRCPAVLPSSPLRFTSRPAVSSAVMGTLVPSMTPWSLSGCGDGGGTGFRLVIRADRSRTAAACAALLARLHVLRAWRSAISQGRARHAELGITRREPVLAFRAVSAASRVMSAARSSASAFRSPLFPSRPGGVLIAGTARCHLSRLADCLVHLRDLPDQVPEPLVPRPPPAGSSPAPGPASGASRASGLLSSASGCTAACAPGDARPRTHSSASRTCGAPRSVTPAGSPRAAQCPVQLIPSTFRLRQSPMHLPRGLACFGVLEAGSQGVKHLVPDYRLLMEGSG